MGNPLHRTGQHREYRDVVEQIQTDILQGRLAPGEKLPAESEMCRELQTSAEILSEALGMLARKNLIEIRSGTNGGAYVKDAKADLMAENLATLIRSHDISLVHLTEFREGVEGTVTGLAAQRATAAESKKLVDLIDDAARCLEEGVKGWNSLVQVDEKVHIEMANIAGNPLYTFALHSIHDNIHRYYDKLLIVGEMEMEENFQDLQLIVEAVAEGDAPRAHKLAVQHIRRFSKYMEHKKRPAPEQT
jgi:DNA-binding FadR family transcriptional regulator